MTSHWLKQLRGDAFYERRWKKEQRALGRCKPLSLKGKICEETRGLASLSKEVLARARTNPFELLNLASSDKDASSLPRPSNHSRLDHGASAVPLLESVCTRPDHTFLLGNRQTYGPLRVLNPDRESQGSSLRISAAEFSSNALQALGPCLQQSFTVLESALPRRLTGTSRSLSRTKSSLKRRAENGRRLTRLAAQFLSNSDFNVESELPRLLRPGLQQPACKPSGLHLSTSKPTAPQLPVSKPKLPRLLTVNADDALLGSLAPRGAAHGSSLGLPLSTFGGPLLAPSDLCLPTCKIWVPYRVSAVAPPQLPPLFDGKPLAPLDLDFTPELFPRFDFPALSPGTLFLGLPPTDTDLQGSFQRRNVTQPEVHKAKLHLFLAKQKCEPWVERQNGNTAQGNFGTALGSACSGLRYSSVRFGPQFSSQASQSARNPWTAHRNLMFLADDCGRPDLSTEFVDDLLYLSSLEFRAPRGSSRWYSAPGSCWSLSEVPEEHEALLDEPGSPLELDSLAESVSSWTSGDDATFTALGPRHNRFVSANLARAGFGLSETFSSWSFVERRNRHRRFLNRDIGSWRRRLSLVKSMFTRLVAEEAALRAVFR